MTSPANWFAQDRSLVEIGHHVTVELDPRTAGRSANPAPAAVGLIRAVSPDRGRPEILVLTGAARGRTVTLWPYQILARAAPPARRRTAG